MAAKAFKRLSVPKVPRDLVPEDGYWGYDQWKMQ
jgi:hypothetical protein